VSRPRTGLTWKTSQNPNETNAPLTRVGSVPPTTVTVAGRIEAAASRERASRCTSRKEGVEKSMTPPD